MVRERILVIEDDPLFRSVIVGMLRKDFFVSIASEGSEGYYKSLEHPPDLAVMDVRMPGWDGLRTLKAFRNHQSLCHIPVVILTGDASKETVLAAIHGGANDYIIKTTFTRDDFLKKIKKLLTSAQNCAEIAQASPDLPAASDINPPHALLPTARRTNLQSMIDDWE